jgi:hypothetical protein
MLSRREHDFKIQSGFCKTFTNPMRFEILRMLNNDEKTVTEPTEQIAKDVVFTRCESVF